MRLSLRGVYLSAALVLTLAACHRIAEEMPEQRQSRDPNPVGASVPIPVIVTPVPLPVPIPNPAPAPNSSPEPVPPPSNPAPPSSAGCSLPPGGGSGNGCPRENPRFLAEAEAALDTLTRQEPAILDLNQTQGCGNCYKVRDEQRYTARLAQILTQRGFCSMYDGEELAVKNSNAFNDQFDILTSGGYIRRQGGSYRSTCYPAWF